MNSMQVTPERRSETRQRVLKGGKIIFGGKLSTFDCTVRNRSLHGARLRLATPEFVPNNFILHIPSDDFKARAQVTNRSRTEVGVRLMD